MTNMDYILIIIGIIIVVLSATQGLIRILIMLFVLYMVSVVAGMATLASDVIQDLAVSISRQLGGAAPPLEMAQVFVFLGLGIALFVGAYFISRAAFADTTIPELGGFDNILGAIAGIVLALLIMAIMCNTWGIAANAPRMRSSPFWQGMKTAYHFSTLKPHMMSIIIIYQKALFMFQFIEYPMFFVPH